MTYIYFFLLLASVSLYLSIHSVCVFLFWPGDFLNCASYMRANARLFLYLQWSSGCRIYINPRKSAIHLKNTSINIEHRSFLYYVTFGSIRKVCCDVYICMSFYYLMFFFSSYFFTLVLFIYLLDSGTIHIYCHLLDSMLHYPSLVLMYCIDYTGFVCFMFIYALHGASSSVFFVVFTFCTPFKYNVALV